MDILDFIERCLADGTCEGTGPGKSAGGRTKAFVNMVESSGDLIDEGSIVDACDQLLDVRNRTDGDPRPPDFLAGEAASELLGLIDALRNTLGCP